MVLGAGARGMKKPGSAQKSAKRQPVVSNELQGLGGDSVVGAGAELHLELPGFEGPFDLLLHLIHEHELDILNIPVAFVTEKYLHYLSLMQELNIDVASEYLVMAATLAHIKSRMLLPTPPPDDDADGSEAELDPRADLIRRLLEYQKYKQVAEQLASRSVLGRDVFTRGAPPDIVEGPAPLAKLGVFKLLEAFQRILAHAKVVVDHQIEFERLSITDRINQLVDRLTREGRLGFDALFEGQRTRAELIVTFLALLEMTRLRLTNIHQDGALSPITIELAVSEEAEIAAAMSRVPSESDDRPTSEEPEATTPEAIEDESEGAASDVALEERPDLEAASEPDQSIESQVAESEANEQVPTPGDSEDENLTIEPELG